MCLYEFDVLALFGLLLLIPLHLADPPRCHAGYGIILVETKSMKMAMPSTWYKDGYLLRQNYTYSKYIYCGKGPGNSVWRCR